MPLTALAVSDDGHLAAVASADNRLALYRLPSLQVHAWTQALEQGGGAMQHVVGHISGVRMAPKVCGAWSRVTSTVALDVMPRDS